MRRNIPTIFAILLLCTLILCSGCTGPGNENPIVNKPIVNTTVIGSGLSQITTPESPYISFEEAKQKFENYNIVNGSAEKLPVYYIISRDVDASGDASSWLFGVHQGKGTVLLIYDRTGWKVNPWNAPLPSEEIVLGQVVPPGTLFTRNKEVIFNASSPSHAELRDLELKQGIYTLTIKSGSTSRTLMFNANTGAMITSYVS